MAGRQVRGYQAELVGLVVWWCWAVGAGVGLQSPLWHGGFGVHCVQLSFFLSPTGQKET